MLFGYGRYMNIRAYALLGVFVMVAIVPVLSYIWSSKIDQTNYNNYQIISDGNIYIIQNKDLGNWILGFDSKGRTAKVENQFYNSQSYTGGKRPYMVGKNCSTVNGGYFGYTGQNKDIYIPVGEITNRWAIDIKGIHPVNDPNISAKINIGDIYSWEAGPILISGSVVNTGLSANISHRQRQVPRTFIIQKSDGSSDIGIYNTGITLANLSEYIYNLDIYTGDYSVINLDGGPSTSIITPDYKFNENQKLPRFFTICEE